MPLFGRLMNSAQKYPPFVGVVPKKKQPFSAQMDSLGGK